MSAKYRVVASLLYQRVDEDTEVRHRAGAVVDTFSKADAARHLAAGNIVAAVDEDFEAPFDDSSAADDSGAAPVPDGQKAAKPANVANKPVLVNWLLEHGTKHGGTREELDELTKDQLWEYIHAED